MTDIGPTADKADADSQKSAEQESAESELRAPTALSDLQIGDRVLGACRFGSYATHLNISAQQVSLDVACVQLSDGMRITRLWVVWLMSYT